MASAFASLPSFAESESGGFVWMGNQGESGGVYNSGGSNDNTSLWGLGNSNESGGTRGTGAGSESGGVVFAHSEAGNSREGESMSEEMPRNFIEPKSCVKTYKW
ncbi:MAG TPA: hypothetical protein V6C76_10945 [Drouetiella sp.]